MNALKKITGISWKIVLVVVSSLVLHFIITLFNIYLFREFSAVTFGQIFFEKMLAASVIPILVSYVLLFGVIFFLFYKFRATFFKMNDYYILKEKNESTIQTAQQITGFIAQYITQYNNEIREWLEAKKAKGSFPQKIENASNNISKAINALTRVAFMFPYEKQRQIPISVLLEKEINS